ncbi:hypothetical protein NMG29_17110 [Streptomyces cocklensis]|uniref:hypothetical protein n=1 Tax=Actinacidiphila cocklensis TaxID=887465 RepID=UPI00203DA0B3|nr:hypothetical protein [Actinacidiphila cocklensis]MDD1059899.1 hypothetical protein [Actinacidiphila cocklensis]
MADGGARLRRVEHTTGTGLDRVSPPDEGDVDDRQAHRVAAQGGVPAGRRPHPARAGRRRRPARWDPATAGHATCRKPRSRRPATRYGSSRVTGNLLADAGLHTRLGSRVTVRLRQDEAASRLVVEDDGPR